VNISELPAQTTKSVAGAATVLEQRRLGGAGLQISRLGLGMMSYGRDRECAWALDEEAAAPIVRRALEHGFTFFDTADMYSSGESEVLTGRLLRKLTRDELVIATKVFYPTTPGPNGGGLSRKHILAAIDASLKRLGTDYVDLYQIHRWDPQTPIEETMQALNDIVRAGKVRYLGASTMLAWQFAKAQRAAERNGWTPFVSMQNRYNLLYREEEREMIPQCLDQRVALLPYSPLAQGFLAGSRPRDAKRETTRAQEALARDEIYGSQDDYAVIDQVAALANERGVGPAQIALAWLLHKPGVTAPIVGATKLDHIDDAAAATRIALTPDDLSRLEQPYKPRPLIP
jgi:aryl-alcohol dehydrogenase-like predicted oxidoreductase